MLAANGSAQLIQTGGSIFMGDALGPAPAFGQHRNEVIAGYSYAADEIAALRERGMVR